MQLATLDQQIMVERRTKRKTQAFFNRLTESNKGPKGTIFTVMYIYASVLVYQDHCMSVWKDLKREFKETKI